MAEKSRAEYKEGAEESVEKAVTAIKEKDGKDPKSETGFVEYGKKAIKGTPGFLMEGVDNTASLGLWALKWGTVGAGMLFYAATILTLKTIERSAMLAGELIENYDKAEKYPGIFLKSMKEFPGDFWASLKGGKKGGGDKK